MEHYLVSHKDGFKGIQDIITICNNGGLLSYSNETRWVKCHLWSEDYIREHGERISRYSLKSSGITPPVRDFKDLSWEWNEGRQEYHAVAHIQGYVDLIIFHDGADWCLHYEDRDPSELIFKGEFYQLQDKAQSLHEESLMAEFFE